MAKRSSTPPSDVQLRDVFRDSYQTAEIPALLQDLKRGSDRTVCIILSSMIERDLESLILHRIMLGMPLSKTRRDDLFDKDGPLSTFSGNIKLARALGVIGSITDKELNAIRKIRNMFAHSALPINFSSREIQKEFAKMRFPGGYLMLFDEDELKGMPAQRADFIRACLQTLTDIISAIVLLNEQVQMLSNELTVFLRRIRFASGEREP
jgi:hypothetical protein